MLLCDRRCVGVLVLVRSAGRKKAEEACGR